MDHSQDAVMSGEPTISAETGTAPTPEASAVRYVIVENVEAPCLKGITTPDFVEFRDKREMYERRMSAINSDSPIHVRLASYRDSIPRHLVRSLILTGVLDATRVEDVAEEDLRQCVEQKVKTDIFAGEMHIIEHRLRDVKMRARKENETVEDQIVDLFSQYSGTLHKWGYDELIDKKPVAASAHIMDRITGEARVIVKYLEFAKPEPTGNFKVFMSCIIECAKVLDYSLLKPREFTMVSSESGLRMADSQ